MKTGSIRRVLSELVGLQRGGKDMIGQNAGDDLLDKFLVFFFLGVIENRELEIIQERHGI